LQPEVKPDKKSHKVRNVIIIAAVVALLALGGSVLIIGLQMGCFTCLASIPASAAVSIKSVTCTGSAGLICTAELQNTGAASTEATGATITFGGVSTVGTCNQTAVNAGETSAFQCNFQTGTGGQGSSFFYLVMLSNGANPTSNGNFTK